MGSLEIAAPDCVLVACDGEVLVFDSHARLNISAVITITEKVFGFSMHLTFDGKFGRQLIGRLVDGQDSLLAVYQGLEKSVRQSHPFNRPLIKVSSTNRMTIPSETKDSRTSACTSVGT